MSSSGARLDRRAFIAGMTALGPASVFARSPKAEFAFTQFHNQPAASTLHHRLVEMWAAIREETRGRVETQVFAENNHIPGSDPAVLGMLVSGEVQFFTLMGGILGNLVPATEVQQVPFVFRSAGSAHRAFDGPLGAYLRSELAAKGIFAPPIATFDNGMRQIATASRPIVVPDDLSGLRIRVPDGRMFRDTFEALGALPVTINVSGIYDGLKSGSVDAQENPLAVVELFRLYEVVKYVSLTNHMWSGFNLLANLPLWKRLPTDITRVIERNVAKSIRMQRQDQVRLNGSLSSGLAARGLVFNAVDPAPFRARLSSAYALWRERLGRKCWSLLEMGTGRLS
jgi:tripartite ATP-independent transporter DctP family solute receptor